MTSSSEQFNPFARNRYLQLGPIQLSQQVRSIVVNLFNNIWPKPPLSKFPSCAMLVVQTTIINQHPITIFNSFLSQSMLAIKPFLVLLSCFLQLHDSYLNILRPSFKLSNS